MSAPVIILETPRLLLRRLTEDDFDEMMRLYTDPDVLRYIGDGTPRTHEQVRDMLARFANDARREWPPETIERLPQLLRSIERDAEFSHGATIEKSTGAFIGRSGLLAWDFDGVKDVEVGYILHKKFWGQRYATEAARAVRDYAFDRLISVIHRDNVASQRVAIKNGMTHERDTHVRDIPVRIYSLTHPTV